MNKLVSNYIYNTLYQFFILLLPLITIPYVTRVIGPEGIGINAYSFSIVQMFMLFALIGVPLYGNRQIASVKHLGKEETSRNFWNIYTIQFISSLLFLTFYLVFVTIFIKENKIIYYAQALMLISSMFDISWLFIGLEELKKVVLRNTIVRLASLASIFILVRDKNDLVLYVLINAFSIVLGQIIMWTKVHKYICNLRIKSINVSIHFRSILLIFLPQLIIQIYVIVDRIMLGTMVSEIEVGFYEQALKIVKVTLSVVTSISTVMLPRIATEYSLGNNDNIKYYNNIIVRFVLMITIPLSVGLMVVAPRFAPWFFGVGYEKVGLLIVVMSPIIIFIGLSNLFGMQILIPMRKQNKLTYSVSVGAVVSIAINIFLIKWMESLGTAIATVVAELIVVLIMMKFIRDVIEIGKFLNSIMRYGIVSLIMGVIISLLGILIPLPTAYEIILQVGVGCIVYIFVLYIIKDEFLLSILKRLKVMRG